MAWDEHPRNTFDRIDDGSLIEIRAVGEAQSVSGVSVELLFVEAREHGAYGAIRVEDRRGTGSRTDYGPEDLDLLDPRIEIRDDIGNAYETRNVSADGSSFEVWRHRFAFVPAPVPDARVLHVTVVQFGNPEDEPAPKRIVPGPWAFRVDWSRHSGSDA